MAGFAAATYLRGIGLVQVPTTLLAQVDASIGGKVGVNLAAGKNLVGAFYPPRLVVTDPVGAADAAAPRVPRRPLRGDQVRHGLQRRPVRAARGARRRTWPTRRRRVVAPIIAECCRIKAAIVSADEREAGPRRVLNFGHTAGHAIEAVTGYRRFRHGEAVAWGMLVASQVAVGAGPAHRGRRPRAQGARHEARPAAARRRPARRRVLAAAMRRDKKVVDGTLHFVLPTASADVGTTANRAATLDAGARRLMRGAWLVASADSARRADQRG